VINPLLVRPAACVPLEVLFPSAAWHFGKQPQETSMAAKKNNLAGTDEQDSAEQKVDVVLSKPARIDGIKRMPGDRVAVNATVYAQLDDAGAINVDAMVADAVKVDTDASVAGAVKTDLPEDAQ
jgi:tetrahydrodipicolinate N-succinyltransferase